MRVVASMIKVSESIMFKQNSPHPRAAKYHFVSKGDYASADIDNFARVHNISRIEGLFDPRHEIDFHV